MRDHLDILKKLKRLANDKSFIGESKTAEEFINKLKKKYNIEDSECDVDLPVEYHEFKYDGSWLEYKLLAQIIAIVTWDRSKGGYRQPRNRNNKHLISFCTEIEAFEISAMFEFYKAKMFEDVQILFNAFINKHDLFPKLSSEDLKNYKPSEESLDRTKKIVAMMEGLSEGNYTSIKAIEYDGEG